MWQSIDDNLFVQLLNFLKDEERVIAMLLSLQIEEVVVFIQARFPISGPKIKLPLCYGKSLPILSLLFFLVIKIQ